MDQKLPPGPYDRLLRLPEVELRVGLKKPTIYLHIKQGRFPRQKKMGSASGWKESDIAAYVADPQGWASRNTVSPTPA